MIAARATAYQVQTTFSDGRVTLTPRTTFRSIAASHAVEQRRRPEVVSATILPVA